MSEILKIKNLTVNYGGIEVLQNITFAIEEGDFVGIAGPNGAGKTTVIKAILGLIPIKAGDVFLFDNPFKEFSDWGKIGYLPQKSGNINTIFPVTVKDVVTLGLLAQKKFPKHINDKDNAIINNILSEVSIFELKDKLFNQLSGGQQQKVLLARALIGEPKLLIFDEPSTALDSDSRDKFFELIVKLNQKRKISILLISHDTGYLGQYASKLLYLDRKLVFFGNFKDFCDSKQMSKYFGEHEKHIICHQH